MSNQARFSIIPGWIVSDPRLKSLLDLRVLCDLGKHTDKQGWCRRSQVKMAQEFGCARSTVQSCIDRLVEIGVVEKHVQESRDGRDSAHFYRVVFDRPPPSGYAFDAWAGEDCEEDNPIAEASDGHPPADIPAPPAGPEPAPPAGPEPAPIKDPQLTPPAERHERERGREDRKAIEKAFWSLVKNWPGFDGMPKDTALPFWFALTEDERSRAVRRFQPWLARLKAQRKDHVPAPSTYFRQKLFDEVADPVEAATPPEVAAPFGKAGMAYRLWIMNQAERPHPVPPPMVQRLIDEGGPRAEDEIISRRAAYSWPRLVELNRRIEEREIIRVLPGIATLGADFVSTELAGPVGQAWKRFFRKARLPWLPVEPRPASDGKAYAWLPAIETAGDSDGDLDRAVAAAWWQFSERCRGHADAA